MPELRTFRDYIEKRHFNGLWEFLSAYVAENPNRLERYSHKVQNPNEAELLDMNIRWIDVLDTPEDDILFDVVVDAEILIAETRRRDRETAEIDQWFRIACHAVLDGNAFSKFTIEDVSIYERKKSSKTDILSANRLVPIIYKEHFDDVAEAFLRKYYPEALERPVPVDVVEVVHRMNLKVEEAQLSRYSTLFGEMVFDDCIVEIWDDEARQHKPLEVQRGTILVDPNVYFLRNLGSCRNTIIHECMLSPF